MNPTILLLGILTVIIVIFLLEFKDMRNRMMYYGLAILILFFACTFAYVCFRSGANIGSFQGFIGAGKLYMSWLSSFFGNIGDVTGYAIKQNWGMVAVNATG